jgi:hypothetical protein
MKREQMNYTVFKTAEMGIGFEKIILLSLLLGVFIGNCLCLGYSGGGGTLNAPFRISNVEDILQMSHSPRDWDKHFVLTNDIDLDGYTFDRALIAPYSVMDDLFLLGLSELPRPVFTGTVNGNGHVIRNLTISGRDVLGLFGFINFEARVYGLGIVDADVSGLQHDVGILVGYNMGLIDSCYVAGTVSADSRVGALAGTNVGYIQNSYASGDVYGTGKDIGGLVGRSSDTSRTQIKLEITNCYSICRLHTDSVWVGGISGHGQEVVNSFWDTEVSGISEPSPPSGGIGLSTAEMQSVATYLDSGWDFIGEEENGCREIWIKPRADGYPSLSVFHKDPSMDVTPCDGQTLGSCNLSSDFNDVLGDVSDYFAARWKTVSTRNDVQSDDPTTPFSRLTVEGMVDILDTTNLVGTDIVNSVLCRAIDGSGRELTLLNPVMPLDPKHCWDTQNPHPKPVTLELWLDPNEMGFNMLKQIDFYVYALFAQPLTVVNVPFAVMEDWQEIAPGLQVKIEEASSEAGICTYDIREKFSSGKVTDEIETLFQENGLFCDYEISDYRHGPLVLSDFDLFYNVRFIDAEGAPTTHLGGQTGGGGGSTEKIRRGTWTNCSGIAALRYTIVSQPRVMRVPLTLRDVPVN